MSCPSQKIFLYSIGWSDVPDHAEKLKGYVFDIERLGADADHRSARWEFFGGESRPLNEEIEAIPGMAELENCLRCLLGEYAKCLLPTDDEAHASEDIPDDFVATVVCAWGKHRSRFIVDRVARWFGEQFSQLEVYFLRVHLSEPNRRLELRHAQEQRERGYNVQQAIWSAKQMGLRRKRREFCNIKTKLYDSLCYWGMSAHWIDVEKYYTDDRFLEWCLWLLPVRAEATASGVHPPRSSGSSVVNPAASTGQQGGGALSSSSTQGAPWNVPASTGDQRPGALSFVGTASDWEAPASIVGGQPRIAVQASILERTAHASDDDAISVKSSESVHSADHEWGTLGTDPHRTASGPAPAWDPCQKRVIVLVLPDSLPVVLGPCVPCAEWAEHAERVDVGVPTRPEYCMSVLQIGPVPEHVSVHRRGLAFSDPALRCLALQALQRRAREVVSVDAAGLLNGQSCEAVEIWGSTLHNIAMVESTSVPGDNTLAQCCYAFIVIQAFALCMAEPLLLFTPEVLRELEPLRHLLPQCLFLETARAVFRLFWLAVQNAAYGEDNAAYLRVWRVLPWLGVHASLSRPSTGLDPCLHLDRFVTIFSAIAKEQLCSNVSEELGWRRPPPPYIDHFDVTVLYTNEVVALPSVFPPLSIFFQEAIVNYSDVAYTTPQIHEDVYLKVRAKKADHRDVLPWLHLDEWTQVFPHLDLCKRFRLLGGLGKRILSLDRLLHAELRQSVEAYLGFVLSE